MTTSTKRAVLVVGLVALGVSALSLNISHAQQRGSTFPDIQTAHPFGGVCTAPTIAGAWVFTTDVGQLHLPSGVQSITAIGTANFDTAGNQSGVFDFTFDGGTVAGSGTYSGSVTVNPDCTGTSRFTTNTGASRTDSIVIMEDGKEIWGMVQENLNPSGERVGLTWTFRFKRITTDFNPQ